MDGPCRPLTRPCRLHVRLSISSHTSLVMVDAGEEWLEMIRQGIQSGSQLGHD